jgi:hypothetical protein
MEDNAHETGDEVFQVGTVLLTAGQAYQNEHGAGKQSEIKMRLEPEFATVFQN